MLYVTGVGLVVFLICNVFTPHIVELFLNMHDDPEVFMATLTPLSLFSLSFLFVGHNVLYATYFSSVTKIRKSVAIVVLRGFVFVLASLFVSVSVLGNWGIWVSQPISEMATLMCSVMHKRQEEGKQIAQ